MRAIASVGYDLTMGEGQTAMASEQLHSSVDSARPVRYGGPRGEQQIVDVLSDWFQERTDDSDFDEYDATQWIDRINQSLPDSFHIASLRTSDSRSFTVTVDVSGLGSDFSDAMDEIRCAIEDSIRDQEFHDVAVNAVSASEY
jgi:hypothetical protein